MKKLNTIICCAILSVVPFATTAQKKGASHAAAHKQLLANAASSKDKIKLIEQNTFIDLLENDLEPELDIYTEGWNSKSVNPFNEKDVPDTQVIDVTGYKMPHNGPLTSPYGYRQRFRRMHKGVDIGIKSNDTIYAAFDGKVRLTAYEGRGYGNYIILRHPNGLETVYGHLNKHLVKPDDVVRAGDPIGLGGSTGRSTGPHLHFETRFMGYAINPSAIFDFANHTTHTDEYTFSKTTYTKARNFAPSKNKRELLA
ncbi:MAG: M23 family metallopeptidase, partial [Muribaculaceae bacterium]|nr:M23 family metallopeptidase [Muribaculaceae bacterium]